MSMNRLEEYLKTPNPVNPEFFFPLTCRQEDVNEHLFSENYASNTKEMDSPCFEPIQRCSSIKFESEKSPFISQSSQYNSKMIYEKIKFEEDSEEHIETPLQKKQDTANVATAAQKKYELRTNLPNSIRMSDGKESQRSLRVLTSEAYDVVCHKGSTTYKIVSEEIINETCDLLSVKPILFESKEQNNIKRRVYDALNVLIALGKLEKKGRKIELSENYEKEKINKNLIKEFQKEIKEKEKNIQEKIKIKTKCIKKEQNIKKLIKRNNNNKKINQNIIHLPFIIIKCETKNIHIHHKNIVEINQHQNEIHADLDSLNFIKFNHKS